MDKKELSAKLKQYRKTFGLTQYELARMLDCNIGTLRFWEACVSRPNEEYREKIDGLFDLNKKEQKDN